MKLALYYSLIINKYFDADAIPYHSSNNLYNQNNDHDFINIFTQADLFNFLV